MKAIDLNSDLGESFGAFSVGQDEKLMQYITSASIACGWHGGDPLVMQNAIRQASRFGVAFGAHPGYPDLLGFGRREMKLSPEEVYAYVLYQLGALDAFVRTSGGKLQHIKPHGALYNQGCKDEKLSSAICRAAHDFDPSLAVLAPEGSAFQKAAAEMGLPFAGEFFADRAYLPDGSLVPRKQPGAVIHDPALAAARVLQMVQQGTVECIDGSIRPVHCVSVCVHGDNEAALESVCIIRAALERNGIALKPIRELIS